MNAPDEVYYCEVEDDDFRWCEDDVTHTDYGEGIRYIRADIHKAAKSSLNDTTNFCHLCETYSRDNIALRAEVQALKRKDERCKCSMAISMTGDGCRYCQPQVYIDKLEELVDDLRTALEEAMGWNWLSHGEAVEESKDGQIPAEIVDHLESLL